MEPMTGFGGSDFGMGKPRSSLMERLIGVVTFKAPIYREIADDTEATGVAAIIVILVSVITGTISGALVPLQVQSQMQQDPNTAQAFADLGINPSAWSPLLFALGFAILQPVFGLIGWAIASWLNALIATKFFQGRTDTSEMMRVFGFAYIFNLLGLIPCVGLIGWVLAIIGNIIGIREAAEFDTGKAVLTVLFSFAITLLVTVGLACCVAFGLAAMVGSFAP